MRINIIGDNIITSLGTTTEENVNAVISGTSGIRKHESLDGRCEPFAASLINDGQIEKSLNEENIDAADCTRFEKLAIASAMKATHDNSRIRSDRRTVIILSTTKGNVELLDKAGNSPFDADRLLLWRSAEVIARHLGNANTPIVVSNACISGVAAQIVAKRVIESGEYDYAIVIGTDVLSTFIISGFQSFKALSDERCQPFDANRKGLNLGEGAGTIVYGRDGEEGTTEIVAGAISNDANHISGPSRTGEGLFQALQKVLCRCAQEDIRFINVHGTATAYNDEMEAIALGRAGLADIPTFSLKAYFGHTLGASGTIETIISSHVLQKGIIPVSLGFEKRGVSIPVNIVSQPAVCPHHGLFIKTVSGFGGCNATIGIRIPQR